MRKTTIIPALVCILATTAHAEIDAATAELARKWDERMAQRDRDIVSETTVLQQQNNARNAECNRLRNDSNAIQRQTIQAQQTEYYRGLQNSIRRRMNELHC